jgi:hypothetical protein
LRCPAFAIVVPDTTDENDHASRFDHRDRGRKKTATTRRRRFRDIRRKKTDEEDHALSDRPNPGSFSSALATLS